MSTSMTARADYRLHDRSTVTGENTKYVLRVRELPEEDKPREKLMLVGPGDLTSSELIAILFGVGTRKEEVMSMSQRVLKEYGELALAEERDPRRLAETLQIPLAKACQLVASFELGRRYYANQGGKPVFVRTAKQAFEHLQGMAQLQKEQLRGLYLNSRYEVIHEEVISIGTLTSNLIHPREVFQPAIAYGAVAVIIAHNHPSGTLEPTDADVAVTQQLVYTGKILGIDLLDHLVIARGTYTSIITNKELL